MESGACEHAAREVSEAKIGAFQMRIAQLRAAEMRALQRRTLQVRLVQVRILQMRPEEGCASQSRCPEIRSGRHHHTQISLLERGLAQIDMLRHRAGKV